MKRILPLGIIALFSAFFSLSSFAQINVASTNGYMVHISITPVAIVPTSATCVNGYNYNVKLNYSISFSGSNIPSSLYTLQGSIGCGTNKHFFQLPNNGGTGTVTSTSNVWTTKKDCSTATLTSMGCTQVVIEIEGAGISKRDVTAPLNITTLPIKLVSFNAGWSGSVIKLNWATATEENNEYFTIERSANANEWISIKTIKGAGNSASLLNYETVDASPLAGVNYYRLRQTDIDGRSSYSDVVSVEAGSNAGKVSLFPVPNSGNTINLRGISNYNENELSLLSTSGAVLHRVNLSKSSVELPALKTGVYIILIKNKITGESTSLRYVKI